jgi:hypothetical protein
MAENSVPVDLLAGKDDVARRRHHRQVAARPSGQPF